MRVHSLALILPLVILSASCDLIDPSGVDTVLARADETNVLDTCWLERMGDSILPPRSIWSSTAVAGDKAYLVLGKRNGIVGAAGVLSSGFLRYDATADLWASLTPMSDSGDVHEAFALGQAIYVITAWEDNPTTRMWSYDTVGGTWTQVSTAEDPPWAPAFAIGDRGYVLGGGTATDPGSDAEQRFLHTYDPAADSWSTLAALGVENTYSLWDAAILVIGGSAYVAGGNVDYAPQFHVWRYDPPPLDTWTQLGDFPDPDSHYRIDRWCIGLAGKGYLLRSTVEGLGHQHDLWSYDPGTDAWTVELQFGDVGTNMDAAFAIGDYGYFVTTHGEVYRLHP